MLNVSYVVLHVIKYVSFWDAHSSLRYVILLKMAFSESIIMDQLYIEELYQACVGGKHGAIG